MIYVSGSFSLSMLPLASKPLRVLVTEVSEDYVRELLSNSRFVSAVGHGSTTKVMSIKLKVEIPYNRVPIKLEKGDRLVVFQLLTRLEEGKVLSEEELKSLPSKWVEVFIPEK